MNSHELQQKTNGQQFLMHNDVTNTHLACQLTPLSLKESSNLDLLRVKSNKYFVMRKIVGSVLTEVLVIQIFVVTASSFQLQVLHTNDVHARVNMFSKVSQACNVEDMKPGDLKTKCYGGVIRRGGFIAEFRKKHKNVLLIDAGDQYQGTLWFHVFRGHIARFFLDHQRYDAMALGNHEFDDEPVGLKPLFVNSVIATLCANMKKDNVDDDIKKHVKDHAVLKRDDREIGIIGYLTPEVVYLSKTRGIKFEDEVIALKREAEILKTKGVNIIIALGHSGIVRDQEIAKAVPDLDVVVGGHSHTLLYNGVNEENDVVEGEYPIVVTHDDGGKTLVVTAGCHGKYIGVLNLTFDSEGKLTEWSGNPVVMDEKIPDDEIIADYLKLVEVQMNGLSLVIIGSANGTFDASDKICRLKECTIGNLYADAIVRVLHESCLWDNFTLAITNGGGIRASLNSGEIKYGDVMSVFPFGDQLIMATVDGAVLLEVFEHSVSDYSLTSPRGKFLQVSGFKVQYDVNKPNGEKVVKLEVKKCFECSEFVDIDKTAKYEVAMPHYIALGGDRYEMLKNSKVRSYDIIDIEILINHLERYSPIYPKLDGRISGLPGAFSKDKSEVHSRATLKSLNIILFIILSLLV